MRLTRRATLGGLAALPLAPSVLRAQSAPRVVVLGAGFGGASLARALRRAAPEVAVTLIEREAAFHTCPFSNGVLGGLWPMDRITFGLEGIEAAGVELLRAEAQAVDPAAKAVILADGTRIAGDVLVL